MVPDDLRYTAEHEWIAPGEGASSPGAAPLRVGITHFAQDALGDIVYVQLPEPGTEVKAGEAFGEVESTKSVSEIYAPLSGTVAARNEQLGERPELVNSDPYGAGWLVEIEPTDRGSLAQLLDAAAYRALTEH